MADFDSKLPVRAAVTDVIVQVADSSSVTIDPAKEGGNLADIKTAVQIMDDWDNGSNRANVDIQSNASINVAQIAATATSVGSGVLDAGTQRVVLATDQPTVAVDGPAAGLGVDVEKIAGTATAVNTGNATAGTQRVVIASDQPAIAVTFTPADLANTNVYSTATVAAANSNTQTYSPASTVYLTDVYASASGQMKVELQFGTTGAEATFAVLFTSKGSLIAHFHLDEAMQILNTQSIKVIRTNTDNQSMDVYSTVCVHA